MVLRIHFAADDLGRTRMAAAPDVMWELVLSLHRLRSPRNAARHQLWLRRARARLAAPGSRHDLRGALAVLTTLVPRRGDFPDFLTPAGQPAAFADALDLVAATPARRLHHDLAAAFRARTPPPWVRRLARGDRASRRELLDALDLYHRELLHPATAEIAESVAAERSLRARSVLDGGVEGLLASLSPTVRWQAPVLTADYPCEQDLHLSGRGVTLVPSFFCRTPVSLIDPALPPVLVYPLAAEPAPPPPPEGLTALLGRTRAVAMCVLAPHPCSTTELAHRLGISPGTASRHAAALRDAGLVTSRRRGAAVLHVATRLGRELAGMERPKRAAMFAS